MSNAVISLVLLLTATFVSSTSNVHVQNEQSVYLRFFPNFAQLFHPAKTDFNASHVEHDDIEHYQLSFTEKAFGQIVEETLTILNADVNERTIVHHAAPNFETVGSRYFYRRDPKESEAVEIELVNVDDRLFREVRRPNRFFYLTTLDGLEYAQRMPVMPFYDVTFTCNVSRTRHFQDISPLLTYIDRNFQWTPRYTLDIRGTPILDGYADIRNNGDHTVMIEGLELVAGDVKLEGAGHSFAYSASESFLKSDGGFVRSMDKEASGTYVYETSVPSAFALSPHSTRSVQFFQANITVDAFHYYSAEFSPVNARGKLLNAYNITSHLSFIPHGRLSLHREGRFLGQGNLPDLAAGETHTMLLGHDADVSYQRLVSLLEGDEQSESITYQVEYIFQNDAGNSVARIDFVESFGSYKYFQIKTFIAAGQQHGTDLRAHLIVPPLASRRAVRYQVEIFKVKPIFNARQ